MLINAKNCVMVVVDMQEKLMPLVVNHRDVIDYTVWLLKISQELGIPNLSTEQYPKALGSTVALIKNELDLNHIVPKLTFSAMATPEFSSMLKAMNKKQVILVGIETHVCMMQTAIELQAQDYQVFVVIDCTSSRNESDKMAAMDRMKHAGITLVTREMVIYEWLREGGTPQFKHINEAYIK
jgi:nicotinamidase-related amidase